MVTAQASKAQSAPKDPCFEQATTDLERAFCEVKQASQNSLLISIQEFKQNTPKIQRLLIKRDAERHGILLPEIQPKTKHQTHADSSAKSEILTTEVKNKSSLVGCVLEANNINCTSERYSLLSNKRNNTLKSEVFSVQNQLLLPRKEDTEFAEQSDYRYLSRIYPTYIYKMLELGLADSTMSFTKFAKVYWQNKMDGLDFSERFKAMYNQLKIEKSRNHVQVRYRQNHPQTLQQCMRLDEFILVCDDMQQNWIYRLL